MAENKEKKKKDYTGFPGDCNEDQVKALEDFKQIIVQNNQMTPEFDTPYLLRFLRARKFDMKKTTIMWNDFINWRFKMEVATIDSYVFGEIEDVQQFYPHGYHKTDKLGRPIYIERLGNLKLQQLFQVTSEERLIKYYVQSYETLLKRIFPKCTEIHGSRVDQTMSILDLKGGSMKIMSKQVYNFIQLASKVAQDNYPEILGRMFIVNAPMLFSGVWAMIKVFLDEKTKSKITIVGSNYKDKLLQFIDEENLPDFLGGKSPCDEQGLLEKNIGPWNIDGKTPLFPGQAGFGAHLDKKDQQLQEEEKADSDGNFDRDDSSDDDDNRDQLDNLRLALGGMSLGGPKKGQNNSKKEDPNSLFCPETPVQTEANEEDMDGPYPIMSDKMY